MYSYQLLFVDQAGHHIGDLGVNSQPFCQFAIGETVDWNGTAHPIVQVRHAILPVHGGGWRFITTVVLQ